MSIESEAVYELFHVKMSEMLNELGNREINSLTMTMALGAAFLRAAARWAPSRNAYELAIEAIAASSKELWDMTHPN